ncbi:lipid A 1-phosphatase LpxE [Aquifex aeolicus]|uniref:Phosphatidic acid phosphatase type 2/haloperoxidase domain-containing protein n=1 Tax=Aquifex aeolicus (strain VF5) TaxID=224324 RepID=O67603_AQUAE|nr:lipid A 1-phosphatase LpxE [Aquifex aeolicus]AAC07576.1 hypothetical protein aq_1706 [Aquifex aeolicus VF5]
MVIEDFALNLELFRLINNARHPLLDVFFTHFAYLGSGYVLFPLLIFLFIFRKEKVKPLILAIILETVLVISLKTFFNQPRPAILLEDVNLLFPLHWRSFPSGDTAMAFTIATVLSHGEKLHIKAILFLYAFLIGYERIYAGVHFPLDVFVGALIGIICGIISLKYSKGGVYERN